jgi:hypothetical protein
MQVTVINLGALTSKVSAYKYRSWELEYKENLDYLDNLGMLGIICIKGLLVVRVIPQTNSFFNWISDKFRFSFDGFIFNRSLRILNINEEILLLEALFKLTDTFSIKNTAFFFLGKTLDYMDSFFLKRFTNFFQKKHIFFEKNNTSFYSYNFIDDRFLSFFDMSLSSKFNNLFIFGLNVRLDMPILYTFLTNTINITYTIGDFVDKSYQLGRNIVKELSNIINGVSYVFKNLLCKNVLIISSLFESLFHKTISNSIVYLKNIFMLKILSYYPISLFFAESNFLESNVFIKDIGGIVRSEKKINFFFDSILTNIFVENIAFNVSFSTYNTNRTYDLVFPVNYVYERNTLSYSLQGTLNYCEKTLKVKSLNKDLWLYFILSINLMFFKYFAKYSLGNLCFVSEVTNVINFFNIKKIYYNKLYINKLALGKYFKVKFIGSIVIFDNLISNYFYTHNVLLNSPTILLSDSRLYKNNYNFIK